MESGGLVPGAHVGVGPGAVLGLLSPPAWSLERSGLVSRPDPGRGLPPAPRGRGKDLFLFLGESCSLPAGAERQERRGSSTYCL